MPWFPRAAPGEWLEKVGFVVRQVYSYVPACKLRARESGNSRSKGALR